ADRPYAIEALVHGDVAEGEGAVGVDLDGPVLEADRAVLVEPRRTRRGRRRARIEGIGPLLHLLAVKDAIAVGVGSQRDGPPLELLKAGQPIGIRVLAGIRGI